MKPKHLKARIEQAYAIAKCSPCCRQQIGALILEPVDNVLLADGYNGTPRGSSLDLCGGSTCLRNTLSIPSGTRLEVGCVHAEANSICNAASNGIRTRGAHMIVTAEPCLACAKLIHHARITKVILVTGGYTTREGVNYLLEHDIEVEEYKYE